MTGGMLSPSSPPLKERNARDDAGIAYFVPQVSSLQIYLSHVCLGTICDFGTSMVKMVDSTILPEPSWYFILHRAI